jgi:hypothetical protein
MNKPTSMIVVACLLGLVACNVEHYDECAGEDPFDDFDKGPSKPSGGSKATGGDTSSGNAASGGTNGSGTNAGGTNSAGADDENGGAAGATPVEPPKVPCDNERDCLPGFNCNYEVNQCEPAAAETCGELDLEADCASRADCIPVYGGTNCSCGQDCECEGGEPGCICESFEFFVCRAAE